MVDTMQKETNLFYIKYVNIYIKIIATIVTFVIISNVITIPTNIKLTSDILGQLSNVGFELEEIEEDYSNLTNGTLLAINSSFSELNKILEIKLNQHKENERNLEEKIFNLIFKKFYLQKNGTVSIL